VIILIYDNKNEKYLGGKLILSALKLDESLAELLKIEVKWFKKFKMHNFDHDELKRMNTLLKNTIIALTLTEEKIRMGIELFNNDKNGS
jgi:hypothetical protein